MQINIDRCSGFLRAFAIAMALGSTPLLAADVTPPAAIADLAAARGATDVSLSWSAVTLDTAGQAESIDRYQIYRGPTPDFVPDTAGGSNLIGTSLTPQFDDMAAVLDGIDYYYLISAVDTADNESNTKDPLVTTPPTLTGFWTNTTIETQWSGAAPLNEVVSYRVYYGRHSRQYEHVLDVGPATSHSFLGLESNVNWYFAVTAVDVNGNESVLSNEHFDPVGGVIRLKAHDEDEICWGAGNCPPAAPGRIQRSDGFQILVPVEFPEGDWLSVKVTYTLDSRLCSPPAQGTVSKCGDTNPGGWNPCGDPWDRIAQLFLVLDDCVAGTGSCLTNDNLELMRAVTPFGTDADPPNGTGTVGPRALTLDVTPYTPLLTGTKYVGAEIVHFTQAGWFVSVDFTFSKKPASASPKPPADGIQIVGLAGAPLPTRTVTIPPEATSVKMRVFTTGHGGSLFCDGGTNNANPCSSSAQCPGGVCNPCDEFCHRTNQMFRDGGLVWSVVPFRTDCSPNGINNCLPGSCKNWNACGCPSCTFPRAGWCPGYIACHHNAPCDQDFDATAAFPPGGTYDIDYSVTPQNGFWPVSVVLYWYE